MNPDRDESTVVDLATINAQGQQRYHQNQSQQQPRQPGADVHIIDSSASTGAARNSNTQTRNNVNKEPVKKDCPRHADGHPPNQLTTRDLGNKRIVSFFFGSDVVLFDSIMSYRIANPDKRVEDAIDTFSEHQSADALANIIYETQAFDMIFKYPIPEHLRKVPDSAPVISPNPTLSDIDLHSTGSAAAAYQEEKSEKKQRQPQENEERLKQEEEQRRLESVNNGNKDVEAAIKDPKVAREEKLERHRIRFKKALLRENLIIEEEPGIEGNEMYMKVYAPFWRLCIEAQRLRYKIELSHIESDKEKAAAEVAAANQAVKRSWFGQYFWQLLQRADNVTLPLRAESLLFKASKLRQFDLAEKNRKWSDIVRHGGGIKPDGSGVGSNMGSDGKDGFFGTGRRGHLTESIIIYCKIRTKRGDRYALKSTLDKKAITDMYTLHDGSYKSKAKPLPNRRTLLYNSWVRSRGPQPLEEIRFYFGEKIALYFAWLEHYTRWLISAAIVGLVFLIYGLINYFYIKKSSDAGDVGATLVDVFDNALALPYALFMSIWSALFVEYWKRKSNILAYQWNTSDFERRERARPEFKPTGTRVSPVTGKMELYYPRYKQLISILISILIVLVSIAIVIVSVGSLILFNIWFRNSGTQRNPYVVSAVTAIMNLAVIMLLGTVYARLAKFLTDNENHRRLTQYEDALTIKRFLFDFVNFYSALVYIAYFKESLPVRLDKDNYDKCSSKSCMGDLTIQLAIVFVGKQFLNQVQELAIPQLQKWWNRKNELAEKASLKGKYKDRKMVKPPQWAKDDVLPVYDSSMFEEYRELVIQFGFCTLFVVAFPIAPIFALLNNILEIRVDAYKLLTQHRRPISQAAQDIGSWGAIMMLMTHIAVFTNACLIAFQSNWMEENVFKKVSWFPATSNNTPVPDPNADTPVSPAVRLLFIFIFEHVVFLIKIAVANLVSDVPQTVKLAIERESYYARLALDDEEPAIDEVLEDQEDESDQSDDEDDWRKRFFGDDAGDDANYDEKGEGPGVEGLSPEEEEEEEEELKALIKAGGCGCAAHGDGIVGTSKGGFEGTWMNRFKPNTQLALKRRQQRRRRRQNANKQQQQQQQQQ
ncbi:Anoctamin-7 [Lobosporangium transversale]|uniref:Calcium-activated chloride channel-domain-containing protein n=1 Tax=Lobosporangium transversale TaxID=64571 RepID=A0A1Y2GHS1_9FUNG|nr:calcium-activated chloride channel-domain-containing protein [Lobosporangium transversale]KAF9918176.1 Anoctamin-7 [Lobosporangium transversale]ORZ07946.1 calcium-activated chloride channel-domain-containing protein [Lobosporangium transversale]|eukprot:XP_021878180.1 calcium-activated chloride channel-domain-containing protein [Lobosporangium transversale]